MINELDLISLVNKYDFALLIETFTEAVDESLFPMHKAFVCPGVKLSDSVHGRLCGGLIMLVKKELCKFVEQIMLELDNIVALKVSRNLVGTDKDVVLVGVYLPPENSRYYEETDIYCGVTMLEDCLLDINRRFGDLPFIIFGDLNARTASLNSSLSRDPVDGITDMMDDENGYDDQDVNKRLSKDSGINSFGKYLINVCDEFCLTIVNGLQRLGFSNDFTYVSQTGCSVIDLFIVSHDLTAKCKDFSILPMIESKHAAVELSLLSAPVEQEGDVSKPATFSFSKYK
jgi:hypothetical protein